MVEKPILFSGPMVRAILDGRKTQTRRVIKPQPAAGEYVADCMWNKSQFAFWKDSGGCTCVPVHMAPAYPGERLWVRETWGVGRWGDRIKPTELKARAAKAGTFATFYQATDSKTKAVKRWRPSIHMPRWACRLLLDVTDVRVERLQEITYNDCVREGVSQLLDDQQTDSEHIHWTKQQFQDLWGSLNDKRGYGWNENPWVWVIEFETQ